VVIATGACDRPRTPAWAAAVCPRVLQVTPAQYRGPQHLPEGGVLVVGASATGVQLAQEIHRSGRPVTLAAGRHVRTPRRYRGRDIFAWLDASGFLLDSPSGDIVRLRSQPSFQLMGDADAPSPSLDRLSAAGVRIVGRARGGAGSTILFDDNLAGQCAAAEARRRKVLARVDRFIAEAGLPTPADPQAWIAPTPLPSAPSALDLGNVGIRTILWATGYRRDYPWLRIPVLDGDGEIANLGGVTAVPGLFVIGLPFMRHRASALIDGVGRDAAALTPLVIRHLGDRVRAAA
jgi:putative flavoprotein involved in K+ transport